MLTQERLKEILHYDPSTGIFIWIVNAGRNNRWKAGRKAGGTNGKHGYLAIRVDGVLYLSHRLAWLYMYGHFPPEYTDHINGNKKDNRIANLRACSALVNTHGARATPYKKGNNTHTGVSFDKERGKYAAYVWKDNKKIFIGRFDDELQAVNARNIAQADIKARIKNIEMGRDIDLKVTLIKPKPENYKNNTTGYKGVSFNKRMNKYQAFVYGNKKRIYLGCFDTAEKANMAVIATN